VITYGFWIEGVCNVWFCRLLIAAVVSKLTEDGSFKCTQVNWISDVLNS
jgi:hypothetical protein